MRSISSSKTSASAYTRRCTRPGSTSLATSSELPLIIALFRGLVGVALNIEVDELQRGGGLFQHVPAFEPLVGPLHFVERDRRRVADDEASFPQILDLERGHFGVGLAVIIDEVVEIGALVGIDAPNRLAHRRIEGGVGFRIRPLGGVLGAMEKSRADCPAAFLFGECDMGLGE